MYPLAVYVFNDVKYYLYEVVHNIYINYMNKASLKFNLCFFLLNEYLFSVSVQCTLYKNRYLVAILEKKSYYYKMYNILNY